jgi:hypothetical protein
MDRLESSMRMGRMGSKGMESGLVGLPVCYRELRFRLELYGLVVRRPMSWNLVGIDDRC